jgi:Domain of unknown function (DUF4158)
MNDWQSTWLGRRSLPRDLSGFEIEAFFNFSDAERRVIEERRGPALKIALALQIGFLRMTGRLLEAVRMVVNSQRPGRIRPALISRGGGHGMLPPRRSFSCLPLLPGSLA